MWILETAILSLLLALVLVGIWFEERLIAFESKVYDRFCDRIGYVAAKIYISHRNRKIEKSVIRIDKAYETISKEEQNIKKLRKHHESDTV